MNWELKSRLLPPTQRIYIGAFNKTSLEDVTFKFRELIMMYPINGLQVKSLQRSIRSLMSEAKSFV